MILAPWLACASRMPTPSPDAQEAIPVQDPMPTEGPAIDASLLTWLGQQNKGTLLQLPIEIHASALGVSRAVLTGPDVEIELRLDTGALSRTLPMALRAHCPSFPCRVWLEGTWGPLFGEAPEGSPPVFAVRGVIGPAEAGVDSIRVP